MSHNTLILSVGAFATLGVITRPLRIPEYVWAVVGAVVMIALGFLPWRDAVAAEADVQRNGPLDPCRAVSIGAHSPKRSGGFEARYRYKVAPRRVPIVLALEVTTSWWPTNLTDRDTQAYPRDEHRQPAVGSAADPRRVA